MIHPMMPSIRNLAFRRAGDSTSASLRPFIKLTRISTSASTSTSILTLRSNLSTFHTFTRSSPEKGDQSHKQTTEEYFAYRYDVEQASKPAQRQWKQELSSESEAAVKADRGEIPDTNECTKDLPRKSQQEEQHGKERK